MTVVKSPSYAGWDKTTDFITLSSSGFPDPNGVSAGSTLYFVDTGESYVSYGNMWELDLRKSRSLETAHYNDV